MPIDDIISLTSKERILLYLVDFVHMEDRYELPSDLVQETISYCTGVQRKHLSKYLDDLMKENLIVERKAHIQGMRQRMNGYYLSPAGYSRACDIRDKVGRVEVEVRDDGHTRKMKVSEVDDATPVRITYCDIVREAIAKGELTLPDLLNVDSKKREALEAKERSSDIYKRALQTAWRDGQVTATERFLIEELRKHLEISESQHQALEAEILKKVAQDHMEFLRIYRGVLEVALADGQISGPEAEILKMLRKTFMVSREEHDELLNEVESYMCGPPGCLGQDSDVAPRPSPPTP
jgi:hypothetical protein